MRVLGRKRSGKDSADRADSSEFNGTHRLSIDGNNTEKATFSEIEGMDTPTFVRDEVHDGINVANMGKYEDPIMDPPTFTSSAIGEYFRTRWTHLVPTWTYMKSRKSELNPIPALREISRRQWLFIFCAFIAWTWDAFDFFSVTLNVNELSRELGKSKKDITMGITLVLMLRSAGAIFFGVLGDRYGTKWPFVANLLLMVGVQIGFSFIHTFRQFLAVRSCFGFVMGGIYGSATATALNDCPPRPRGFISGLVQQGYAFGYLLAVIFNRALAETQSHKWRAVYWLAGGVSFLIAMLRAYLPETDEFLAKESQRREAQLAGVKMPSFFKRAGNALKTYWLIAIYLVLLMAGFNFMSHGSQDLYPTYLQSQLQFTEDGVTVTMCVANIGALVGGLVIGHLSTFVGRRLSILICCIGGGALVYPYGFVKNTGINAAAFFLQLFVQGAFGVVPAHLTELSHPDFKTVIVGLAYQLGNLASSASSTIETDLSDQFPLGRKDSDGKEIYDYGKVICIFMGAVFGYLLVVTFLGPENSRAVRAIADDKDEAENGDKKSEVGSDIAHNDEFIERKQSDSQYKYA